MSALSDQIAEVLEAELDEHGCEDDDEKRWQVARHWAERVAEALTEDMPERVFTDDLGRRWEWCGGQPGTWAWRVTRGQR